MKGEKYMSYDVNKYRYVIHDGVDKNHQPVKEVIAISTYAGRTVRGVAKCDPRDEYSVEAGKALAAARCELKVSEKRAERAKMKYDEAMAQMEAAKVYFAEMEHYLTDSMDALAEARCNLNELLSTM